MRSFFILLFCILLNYTPAVLNAQSQPPATNQEKSTQSSSVDAQDSLALVALYNATDGENWLNNENWLTGPVSSWYGVMQKNNKVVILNLCFDSLRGTIPPEIGQLTELEGLDLGANQLTGNLPPELGNLNKLTHLEIDVNKITGNLPPEIGNLASLKYLSVYDNKLNGELPKEIGNLPNILALTLGMNQFSGKIPSEIGNLSTLKYLDLYNNEISGEIPVELCQLPKLEFLYLTGNNISGEIPKEIGQLKNIVEIYLSWNQLTGEIPSEIGQLNNLGQLHLSNNQLTGIVPEELEQNNNMFALTLYNNKLTDFFPGKMIPWNRLTYLRLENNNFTFEDIEDKITQSIPAFTYAPQENKIGKTDTISADEGKNFSLTVSCGGKANKYQWYFNGKKKGLINSDSTYTFSNLKVTDSGSYSCKITNDNVSNLEFESEPIYLEVIPSDEPIIPNAFTPNDDGVNDYFVVPNIEKYPDAQLDVFNRQGKLVFQQQQYGAINNWWDGKTNTGQELPSGTYFVVLKLDETNSYKGTVYLKK